MEGAGGGEEMRPLGQGTLAGPLPQRAGTRFAEQGGHPHPPTPNPEPGLFLAQS